MSGRPSSRTDPATSPEGDRLAQLGEDGDLPFPGLCATPRRRVLGASVSQVLMALAIVPAVFVMELLEGKLDLNPTSLLLLWVAFPIAMVALNLWLMATRAQTIGKLLMGTQVVDELGQPASLGLLVVRLAVEHLLVVMASVGYGLVYVWVYDKRRLTLYDRLCGTRVVDYRLAQAWRALEAESDPYRRKPLFQGTRRLN